MDPANASELATIAREVGAKVMEGNQRCQSGSWQLGDVDLVEHLDRYREERLIVVFVPSGGKETFTCGVCGFVMDALGKCPRRKLMLEDAARVLEDSGMCQAL